MWIEYVYLNSRDLSRQVRMTYADDGKRAALSEQGIALEIPKEFDGIPAGSTVTGWDLVGRGEARADPRKKRRGLSRVVSRRETPRDGKTEAKHG